MPSFSKKSRDRLDECHPDLQEVFNAVIEVFDCTILEGHRPEDRQNRMVEEGKSQVRWPRSKHNSLPSRAVDVSPYPIDWNDRERFTLFAGFVLGVAHSKGITLRWGGDWDQDTEVDDNTFDDLPHFEIADVS